MARQGVNNALTPSPLFCILPTECFVRPIKMALFALLMLTGVFWALADSLFPTPFTYFAFRDVFIQFSGVMAIVVMGGAMVLAVRSRRIEAAMHGLDKMYRLHKWFGISALVFAVAHWWFALGTKWMVGWGWLEKPQRGTGGPAPELGMIEQLFRDQRGFAESVGEWAFYIIVVFIAVALTKRIPYRFFQKTHRWIVLPFLALAYHALVLTDFEYWRQPVGWLVALALLAGTVAAALSLIGRIGIHRRTGGRVDKLTFYPALNVLETEITLDEGWSGHKEGQFAFLTIDATEGAHPFTIASDWDPLRRRMTFITKALGDYTAHMPAHLDAGRRVTVEGPYGCFTFDESQPRQIWVGAGIGITPFISRMKRLSRMTDGKRIDLFHPSADVDPDAIEKLKTDASAAGVRLHLVLGRGGPRIDGTLIRETVSDWREASVWFCGPVGFGDSLRQDMESAGLPVGRFHQELFQMR